MIPDIDLVYNLIPIQFSTSDNPKNYVFSSTNSEIDGKIGEFGWDSSSKKWVLKRIRTDRDLEIRWNKPLVILVNRMQCSHYFYLGQWAPHNMYESFPIPVPYYSLHLYS